MRSVGFRELPERGPAPELWGVRLDGPAERLYCDLGGLMALVRALYGMDAQGWRVLDTTDPDVMLVELGRPLEWIAAEESDMRALMACLRRNGMHGSYRKAGTEKEYRF